MTEQSAFTWCRSCGRLLTDRESVAQGRGERCAELHIAEVVEMYVTMNEPEEMV